MNHSQCPTRRWRVITCGRSVRSAGAPWCVLCAPQAIKGGQRRFPYAPARQGRYLPFRAPARQGRYLPSPQKPDRWVSSFPKPAKVGAFVSLSQTRERWVSSFPKPGVFVSQAKRWVSSFPKPERRVSSFPLAGLLGIQTPLLAAFGHRGDLILEPFDSGLKVLMLALPSIAAFSKEPDQGTGPAGVILASGCPSQFDGGIDANVPLVNGPKYPPVVIAQQKNNHSARSIGRVKINLSPRQPRPPEITKGQMETGSCHGKRRLVG